MRFLIFNQNNSCSDDVVNHNCQEPHIWISIRNTDTDPISLADSPYRKAEIFMVFDDSLQECGKYLGYEQLPISDKQAKEIVSFVAKWKEDVTLICVNCVAGISRSAACALALSLIINGDDSGILSDDLYSPNERVLDFILKNGKPIETDKTP